MMMMIMQQYKSLLISFLLLLCTIFSLTHFYHNSKKNKIIDNRLNSQKVFWRGKKYKIIHNKKQWSSDQVSKNSTSHKKSSHILKKKIYLIWRQSAIFMATFYIFLLVFILSFSSSIFGTCKLVKSTSFDICFCAIKKKRMIK